MTQKVLLDVDTGTDDAVALMCAALHPALELVAATTVNGNVAVEFCTENTLRVFDHIGVSIPVYEGMSTPLMRADFPVPRSQTKTPLIHGNHLPIPAATSHAREQSAVDFLIEYYLSPAGPETILVPVGPLSNVGAALQREPRLAERIPAIVLMGGGHAIGNTTPSAEFNIWADPEAARIVFLSGVPSITVVPLDATHEATVSRDDCGALRALGAPAAKAAAEFIEKRIAGYQATHDEYAGSANTPVHDALAVLSIVEPGVLREVVHVFGDVETTGELTVGRTVFDVFNRLHRPPNVHVALGADRARFVALLMETLARTA
ncbi:MAG TPA: nucleoside hydrolase [Aggregatilineaceae bacterium]|nr:nucleoside hydrolase [Aggregatilineaceae bacterium]